MRAKSMDARANSTNSSSLFLIAAFRWHSNDVPLIGVFLFTFVVSPASIKNVFFVSVRLVNERFHVIGMRIERYDFVHFVFARPCVYA